MTDVLAAASILAGTAFALIGAVGLQRFEDVFARMHAATKPVTLGLALVLVGVGLLQDDAPTATKLLLAAALQFITAPIGAHMIGRAAYRAGGQLGSGYSIDELADVPESAFGSPWTG